MQTDEFLDILSSHSFMPWINSWTRVTTSTATLVDNIFINYFTQKITSAIVYNDISNHFPIILKVATHFNRNLPITTNSYRVYNKNSINLKKIL